MLFYLSLSSLKKSENETNYQFDTYDPSCRVQEK